MHTRVELDCPLGQRHFESHWAQATVKPDKTDDTLNTNHYHLLRAIQCESRKKNPLRCRSGFLSNALEVLVAVRFWSEIELSTDGKYIFFSSETRIVVSI
jgi:hypothetical protein